MHTHTNWNNQLQKAKAYHRDHHLSAASSDLTSMITTLQQQASTPEIKRKLNECQSLLAKVQAEQYQQTSHALNRARIVNGWVTPDDINVKVDSPAPSARGIEQTPIVKADDSKPTPPPRSLLRRFICC